MNNCCFVGRITANPELKKTTTGKSVCSFTLAIKRPFTKDITDFLNFIAWNQSAEYISKYGHKGNLIAVSGVLTTRKYTVDEQNRTAYEIVADSVSVLSVNDSSQISQIPTQDTNGANFSTYASETASPDFEVISGDQDLPFNWGLSLP